MQGQEGRAAEGMKEERSGEGKNRRSRNKKLKKEGKKLMNFVEETA